MANPLCDYCKTYTAVFRLYHRDETESVICDNCHKPDNVRNIAKLGLEFKNDYKIYVQGTD